MRENATLILLLTVLAVQAQPVFEYLHVHFALYNNGQLVSPNALRTTKEYRFLLDGKVVGVGGKDPGSVSCSFGTYKSDAAYHRDTLWMEIFHKREHMRIAFPPRLSERGLTYTADGLRIDFKPGTVVVTDLPKRVHLCGTIANIGAIRDTIGFMNFYARAGQNWARSIVIDPMTGYFEGDLDGATHMEAGREWVDVEFVASPLSTLDALHRMVVRVPYRTEVHMGTIPWVPSRFRMDHNGLHIETGLPRDTVIGDPTGTHVRINPINPSPTDSVRFEFTWENSGQPHQASMGGLYMKDCCTYLCDFTFAVRTDTDVYGESWPHHVTLYLPPKLEAGRYRIRQVAAQGANLRDVDFLLGKDLYFTVGERKEP